MKGIDENSFSYTATIGNFSQIIVSIFSKMVDDLAKIPEV